MKKIIIPVLLVTIVSVSTACSSISVTKSIDNVQQVTEGVESAQQIGEVVQSLSKEHKNGLFKAKVRDCYDGDTCTISTSDGEQYQLRLLNIDSPEIKSNQWLAQESAELARRYLVGKKVMIELSQKNPPKDKYGRLLGYIWLDEKTMYQDIALKEGLAIVRYVYSPDNIYESRFKAIEDEARRHRKGVWAVEGYANHKTGYNMSVIK
jgi:micrococcal nuclease